MRRVATRTGPSGSLTILKINGIRLPAARVGRAAASPDRATRPMPAPGLRTRASARRCSDRSAPGSQPFRGLSWPPPCRCTACRRPAPGLAGGPRPGATGCRRPATAPLPPRPLPGNQDNRSSRGFCQRPRSGPMAGLPRSAHRGTDRTCLSDMTLPGHELLWTVTRPAQHGAGER